MNVAHGPSHWAADEAVKDAQRKYDDAVRFGEPDYKVKEARAALQRANAHLDRVDRTGE